MSVDADYIKQEELDASYLLVETISALRARNAELEAEVKDRAYSEKCVTKNLHDALDERDDLKAALDALVVQVNKAIESYMLDDSGKFAENISALRMQAIAAAEGR